MSPKDAELNFGGGPWGNFSLTNSFKADKGCGKPNRTVTVKKLSFCPFGYQFSYQVT